MGESEIISILKSDKNLYGECHSCGESFQFARATRFFGLYKITGTENKK